MFEHETIDNQKLRVLPASDTFVNQDVLELREPKNGQGLEVTSRLQHAVVGNVLVERFLPPESIGDTWPHDASAAPWWEVVSHPPHGGVVAKFNAALGGSYQRELDPKHNVVAFAGNGEEVLMEKAEYVVVRNSDQQALRAPSILALRKAYYA